MKKLLTTILMCVGASATVQAQSGPDILWSTNTHLDYVVSVAYSADSTRLASGGSQDGNAKVWALAGGTLLRTVHLPSQERVLSVALSSDGLLIGTGGDEGGIRVWRVTDGAIQWQNSPGDPQINSVGFSHDDSKVIDARGDSDFGRLYIHNAGNGQADPLEGYTETSVNAGTFSPDDSMVASGGADNAAKLWRVSDYTLLRSFIGHSNDIGSVDFSPNGKLLATASADGTARIWNVTNGGQLVVMDGGGGTAKFTADGKYLFTLSGDIKIWRVASGAYVGGITNLSATTFDIAKNGKYFAYGTSSGTVVLARMPVVIDELVRNGNETVLQWQGGSGLYQLQSRTNLFTAPWENLGNPTTNTVATNMTSSTLFFRVQSLPVP